MRIDFNLPSEGQGPRHDLPVHIYLPIIPPLQNPPNSSDIIAPHAFQWSLLSKSTLHNLLNHPSLEAPPFITTWSLLSCAYQHPHWLPRGPIGPEVAVAKLDTTGFVPAWAGKVPIWIENIPARDGSFSIDSSFLEDTDISIWICVRELSDHLAFHLPRPPYEWLACSRVPARLISALESFPLATTDENYAAAIADLEVRHKREVKLKKGKAKHLAVPTEREARALMSTRSWTTPKPNIWRPKKSWTLEELGEKWRREREGGRGKKRRDSKVGRTKGRAMEMGVVPGIVITPPTGDGASCVVVSPPMDMPLVTVCPKVRGPRAPSIVVSPPMPVNGGVVRAKVIEPLATATVQQREVELVGTCRCLERRASASLPLY